MKGLYEAAVARFRAWRLRVRESLWFIPGCLTILAVLLAITLVEIDRSLRLDTGSSSSWAFGGGAEGARGVLQAIAGSLVTVTATVFSITIVVLQLASTQFTPRLLGTFTRDRVVQTVLGVFIGTFTYALLVLRAIRSEADDRERFVPSLAVVTAIGLALICVGCLIFFVHHVARSIRVASAIDRVVLDGERLATSAFPRNVPNDSEVTTSPPPGHALDTVNVHATRSGYLLGVNMAVLFALQNPEECEVEIFPVVGDFVLEGEAIAAVRPGSACSESLSEAIRKACVLGSERTVDEDLDLPIRQLADIAVKALSPGVNDPTTAITCIDRLAGLLVTVAATGGAPANFRRSSSPLTVHVPSVTFARLLATAFDQIQHYGAGDPSVASHVYDVLRRLERLVPAEHQPDVRRQRERTNATLTGPDGVQPDAAAIHGRAPLILTAPSS